MIVRNKLLLKKYIKKARDRGETVIIKTGCFDILHPGHLDTIKRLQKLADVVVVGVHCDEQVRKKKGEKRPINPQMQRAVMVDGLVEGLEGMDYVFPVKSHSRKEYIGFLNYIQPDFVAITKKDKKKTMDYSQEGWKLIEISDKKLPGYSTSEMIKKIVKAYRNTDS